MSKKKLSGLYLWSLVFLLIGGIFFTALLGVNRLVDKTLPEHVEVIISPKDTNFNFGFYDLLKTTQTTDEYDWTAYSVSTRHVNLFLDGIGIYSECTACDGDYAKLNRFTFLQGCFFEKKPGESAPAYCVIDEKLAHALWPEEELFIGKKLRVDTTAYEVCGVIHTPDDLVSETVLQGVYRIYIPYDCELYWRDTMVHGVQINLYKPEEWSTFTDLINSVTGGCLKHETVIRDYTEERKLSVQFRDLCFDAVFIMGIILLCFTILHFIRVLRKRIFRDLGKQYLTTVLKSERGKILLTLLSVSVCIGGIALLFVNLKGVYIPKRYISYDNIFRLGYYLKAWARDAAFIALNPTYFSTYVARMLVIYQRVEWLLLAGGVVFYALGVFLLHGLPIGYVKLFFSFDAAVLSVVIGMSLCKVLQISHFGTLGLLLVLCIPLFIFTFEKVMDHFLKPEETVVET